MILGNLLTQICTIKQYNNSTPSGPTYSTEVTNIPCRVQNKTIIVNKGMAEEFVSKTQIFINYSAKLKEINRDSIITVNGLEYEAKEVELVYGFKPSHFEVHAI